MCALDCAGPYTDSYEKKHFSKYGLLAPLRPTIMLSYQCHLHFRRHLTVDSTRTIIGERKQKQFGEMIQVDSGPLLREVRAVAECITHPFGIFIAEIEDVFLSHSDWRTNFRQQQ